MKKTLFPLLLMATALLLPAAETLTSPDAPKRPVPALPPVQFKGKPFFPLGLYDFAPAKSKSRTDIIDPEFLQAGGNLVDYGRIGTPDRPDYEKSCLPKLLKDLEKIRTRPEWADVALLVQFDGPLLYDAAAKPDAKGVRFRPLSGSKLAERQAHVQMALEKLRRYPNIIGYTMDEPENKLYAYFKTVDVPGAPGTQDERLAKKMVEWSSWINPLVRRYHPQARLMPILAWWHTYADAGAMYDVLIANQYPRSNSDVEFAAPLYEISYDAMLMAEAARRNGKTAIYMPPCFDLWNGKGKYRFNTYKEQLYVMFAPITRGAMGIHAWRLNRASAEHRRNVVYPAMRQVNRFKAYFLGSWHDEAVGSDRDLANADYLKSFPARVRLVADAEDNEVGKVAATAVPDVSYCLRRHPDGASYLLLAVNNRREPLEVNFKLRLQELPAAIRDEISETTVPVTPDGAFRDRFAPFDVKAYIIKPGKNQ